MRFGWTAVVAAALVCSAAHAQTAGFTFDGEATTTRTSASETVNGLTLTITRPGSTFTFDSLLSGPPSFGAKSLSPFTNSFNAIPFVFDFSTGLRAISVQYGDFGADTDAFTMSIYSGANGTGALLGTITQVYPMALSLANGDIFTAGLVSLTPFLSATLIGGGPGGHSIYYDNVLLSTDPIPEPASWAMMITGAGFIGGVLRRLRKRPALA